MPKTPELPRIIRRRSKLHGWGVFALEPINKNTRIITYDGELIDHKESLKRETKYLKRGEIWCFTVNRRWVRDAMVGGNVAPIHQPRVQAELLQPDRRQGRSGFAPAATSKPGEELTYNYYTDGEQSHPVPLPARLQAVVVSRSRPAVRLACSRPWRSRRCVVPRVGGQAQTDVSDADSGQPSARVRSRWAPRAAGRIGDVPLGGLRGARAGG